jgi:hypothetical protein
MRLATLVTLASVVCFVSLGCENSKVQGPPSVKQVPPGYGVMVASFKYVPNESKYPQGQVIYDAKYAASRLSAVGFEAFVVYKGGNWARVGVRAPSHSIAESLKRRIDHDGAIDLKDGNKLKVPYSEIVNLAELQPGTVEEIK